MADRPIVGRCAPLPRSRIPRTLAEAFPGSEPALIDPDDEAAMRRADQLDLVVGIAMLLIGVSLAVLLLGGWM